MEYLDGFVEQFGAPGAGHNNHSGVPIDVSPSQRQKSPQGTTARSAGLPDP